MKTVGIIAGNRQLPIILTRGLKRSGHRVVLAAHLGETLEAATHEADDFLWIKIGQVGRIIKYFHSRGVAEIFIAGSIDKGVMFTSVRPDRRALKLLTKMRDKGDDTVLRGFASILEQSGFKVQNPLPHLGELLAGPGCLTRRRPNAKQLQDVDLGYEVLRQMGPMDIGQAVAIKDGVVLAVEAMEGTDEMIRRGGRLGRGGVVVVKISKPGQDMRFDQPAVGLDTVFNMMLVNAAVLAVEAEKTLIFDKHEVLRKADESGISIIARKITSDHGASGDNSAQ